MLSSCLADSLPLKMCTMSKRMLKLHSHMPDMAHLLGNLTPTCHTFWTHMEQCMPRSDIGESAHSTDFFAGLCGEYRLNAEQFGVFEEFSRTMRQCALAFLCVAATNLTLTMSQVGGICQLFCTVMCSLPLYVSASRILAPDIWITCNRQGPAQQLTRYA